MKKLLTIFLLLVCGTVTFSQPVFKPDDLLTAKPNKLVNDYASVLTADQQQALEYKLDTFAKRTSTQIAVVLIPSLGDDDVEAFNVKLGRAWGVGGKQNNNGVILLISTGDHKLNISTGYGIEGALPDITCKQIIDNIIVPNFKGNDYYGGISQGVDAIIKATQGEYTAPASDDDSSDGSIGKVIFIIVILIILLSVFRGGGGGFLGPFLLGNMLGSAGRGGWSGGGGSGGGFGGFGGGSFGGGGASGSW